MVKQRKGLTTCLSCCRLKSGDSDVVDCSLFMKVLCLILFFYLVRCGLLVLYLFDGEERAGYLRDCLEEFIGEN